jgi:hypothetical protein
VLVLVFSTVLFKVLCIFHLFHYVLLNEQIFAFLDEAILFKIGFEGFRVAGIVKLHSKFKYDLVEMFEFFLHFLVMAAALLCLSCTNKG